MKKPKNPITDLKDQISANEATLAEIALRADALSDERITLIRNGATDGALDAKDAEIVDFEKQARRARERLHALQEQLAQAEADAAVAAQADLVERANATAIAAANEARNFWRDAVPKIRSVIRRIAEADAMVKAANKGLPPGDALPSVERRMRCRPAIQAHRLSEKTVKRWAFESSDRLVPEDRVQTIEILSPGIGKLEGSGWGLPKRVELREFVERRSVPARLGTGYIKPLAASLCFPGLRDGEPAGWIPLDSSASPAAILRALDELEAAPASDDDRKEIVEIIPLDRALAEEIDESDEEFDDEAA